MKPSEITRLEQAEHLARQREADGYVTVNGIEVPLSTIPFSLSCYECDAGDDIGIREQAILTGWTSIRYDDGPSWNFLGCCPECRAGFDG